MDCCLRTWLINTPLRKAMPNTTLGGNPRETNGGSNSNMEATLNLNADKGRRAYPHIYLPHTIPSTTPEYVMHGMSV